MNLKQWLIKQFGSKEFVEKRMTSIPESTEETPPEPKALDISPPAQELAEAIESGAIALYKTKEEQWTTRYKHIGMNTEFFYNKWDGMFNTRNYAFTNDEAKLLGQALRTYNARELVKNKAGTRDEIAEYVAKVTLANQAIDK